VRVVVVASDGGQESTATTAASVTAANTTATAGTTMARFKRSEIQTHYFLTLDALMEYFGQVFR